MKVSRITTTKLNGKDHVRLYGYNEDGEMVKEFKEFKNYFYMEDGHIHKLKHEYKIIDAKIKPYNYNLDKEFVSKIELNGDSFFIPKYIRDIAYQSDIKIEQKFMNDTKMEWSRKRHIAYFDIETYFDVENPSNNNVDVAEAPVTSITFYSSLYERYFILVWHPTIKVEEDKIFNIEVKNEIENYYYFDNEEDLLKTFCYMIKELDVDIITGWYSHGYDIPYLANRLDNIGLNKNMLSPEGNFWMAAPRGGFGGAYVIRCGGLDTIDMMEVVSGMNYNLQNNKLDTAAKEILGGEFMKVTEATWRDWEDNLEGFLKYAVRDVEILWKIDDKLKIFEYLVQMQILSNVTALNEIQSVTRLIDSLILFKFWDQYVFPNNTKKDRVNFKGGLTIDPTLPGVHNDVAVFDYASLYPTTIMAYNISPETYLFSLADLGYKEFDKQLQFLKDNDIKYVDTGESDELFGERYIFLAHTEKVGIYTQLTHELYHMRKMYQKKKREATDEDEILLADKRQYAIKIILNSMFGAVGFPYFRLSLPEAADAITYYGRKANRFAMDKLGNGYGTVLYSDTDSVGQNSVIRYRIKQK